jgi:hypothetical protein
VTGRITNQEEITQAARVLTTIGDSDSFNRGVAALAEMLRIEQSFSLKTPREVVRAACTLLAQDICGDFSRGVLSLTAALIPHRELAQLQTEASALRDMLAINGHNVPRLLPSEPIHPPKSVLGVSDEHAGLFPPHSHLCHAAVRLPRSQD